MRIKTLAIIAFLFIAPVAYAATTISHTGISTPWKANTSIVGVSSGLVGYWTFDGKNTNWTANTTADSSGQGNTGTLNFLSTTTSPTIGKVGQAFQFRNSLSQCVSIGGGGGLNNQQTASISLWVKWIGSQPAGLYHNGGVVFGRFQNFGFSSNNEIGLVGGNPDPATANIIYTNAGSDTVTSTMAAGNNTWRHIVITYTSGTGNIKMYIDGTLNASGTIVTAIGNGSATPLQIGCINSGQTSYSNAVVDDVRVYNRALSATEIQTLYQQGAGVYINTTIPAISSGLVGYWTFNGPSMNWTTNTAADISGQGNTGTLVNMSTTTSPVSGKIGQALTFNGTTQAITCGTNFGLSGDFAGTISAWVKTSNVSAFESVFVAGTAATFESFGLSLSSVNPGGVSVEFNGGRGRTTAGNLVSANTWYHLVVTKSPGPIETNATVYINGIAVATSGQTGTPNFVPGICKIGVWTSGGIFTGTIDDVRIYNRALSAAEVSALYQLGK